MTVWIVEALRHGEVPIRGIAVCESERAAREVHEAIVNQWFNEAWPPGKKSRSKPRTVAGKRRYLEDVHDMVVCRPQPTPVLDGIGDIQDWSVGIAL